MSEELSAETVRGRHLAALGPTLGPLYHALHNEVAALHIHWAQYRELFAHSPERVALLNQAAGQFFRIVQDVLWADVLLSLARLTDSPKSGRNGRLSIKALAKATADQALRKDLDALAGAADTPFIRDIRNRRLAHRNKEASLGTAEPLPEINRQQVEQALAAVRSVMNRVERHFFNSQVRYDLSIEGLGGALALLFRLRFAVETQQAYLQYLKAGGASLDFMHVRGVRD